LQYVNVLKNIIAKELAAFHDNTGFCHKNLKINNNYHISQFTHDFAIDVIVPSQVEVEVKVSFATFPNV